MLVDKFFVFAKVEGKMLKPSLGRLTPIAATLLIAVILGAAGFGLWYRATNAAPRSVGIPPSGNSEPTSSQQLSGSAAPTQPPGSPFGLDTSSWTTLNNKYGWTLKYPASWQANGHESSTPGEDIAPYLEGPVACYEQGRECGYFSMGVWLGSVFPNEKTETLAGLGPRDFLLATQFPTPPDPSRVLLSQGDLTVDGVPAYYVVVRQTNFEEYPNGIIMKEIEVKARGDFYGITYYETGSNKALIAGINSPSNWQLNSIFERIVSTITFH